MVYPNFKNKHLEKSLFTPMDFVKYKKYDAKLPKKYIIIYSLKAVDYIKEKYKPKQIKYSSVLTIYKYKDLAFVKIPGIGSPNASVLIEELIASSQAEEFLNIGVAGGLNTDGFFVCSKALRDEGVSHHYEKHSKYAYPNKELTNRLTMSMQKAKIDFKIAPTWTIDAPYRETKAEIKKYVKEGIATVEMEASAVFTIANYRKVKAAAAFYVSDVLGKKWEPKFHKKETQDSLNKLVDVAVECLLK